LLAVVAALEAENLLVFQEQAAAEPVVVDLLVVVMERQQLVVAAEVGVLMLRPVHLKVVDKVVLVLLWFVIKSDQ
tara:strand:+ start:752 stop:976 length:225 start_codon:yes stop_codon:yes gene_type:complete